MVKDLTRGAPSKTLIMFSAPLLVSAAFQQFYNMADSVIAGRFVGKDALAAIGASFPVTMIIIAIAVGLNTGCSVVISQLFGSRKMLRMKCAVYTALVMSVAVGIVLTALGILFSSAMLYALNTPADIFEEAGIYLNIYIFGLFSLLIYNICNGVFAALGDSKTPLYFLVVSSIGNVFLDIFMVTTLDMGIAGLAWATFIAQSAAAVLAFAVLMKRMKEFKTGKVPIFSGTLLKMLLKISIPSILQQSFVSVGNLFIQALVNSYGADVIAGYSAAIKLNTFVTVCITTLGSGVSNFAAQNYGAGKMDRVRAGFKAGVGLMAVVALIITAVYMIFAAYLMGFFVDIAEKRVVDVGVDFMRIVAPFYIVVGVKIISDGTLRGTGQMAPFMVSTFTDLLLRVGLSFVLVNFFNEVGIWLSWPFGWILGALVSLVFYKLCVYSKNTGMKTKGL